MFNVEVRYYIGSLLATLTFAQLAQAQFVDHQWVGGTSLEWHTAANWNPAEIPDDPDLGANDGTYRTATVSAAGNLSISLGSAPASVAGVTLGGTGVATTMIGSADAAGVLTFANGFGLPFDPRANGDFNGDRFVNGQDFLTWQRNVGITMDVALNTGDANNDFFVDAPDLAIWRGQYGERLFQDGAPFIVSRGAAGSANTISAPVRVADNSLEIDALTAPLSITGDLTAVTTPFRFLNVMRGQVTLNNLLLEHPGTSDRVSLNAIPPATGDLIINGTIKPATGSSPEITIEYGGEQNNSSTRVGRLFLNGPNETTGNAVVAGRVVLGHNNALGVNPSDPLDMASGSFHQQADLSSSNDDVNIPNNFEMSQNVSFSGTHRLTLSGAFIQGNNRNMTNNMGLGGSLVLAGDVKIWEAAFDGNRDLDILGPGTTRISGSLGNNPGEAPGDGDTTIRRLHKDGTGTLIIDVAPGANDHRGRLRVRGAGNVHFANDGSLNVGTNAAEPLILAEAGAVGVDSGSVGNATFIGKIDPASDGGFMLAATEGGADVDFTSVDMTNAQNMSLAGPETGLTYTGSITPFGGFYRLGGGAGTLTVNSALVDANGLIAKNGGTVILAGAKTYTGATSVEDTTTLRINSAFLSDGAGVTVAANAFLDLSFVGADTVATLSLAGAPAAAGQWGSLTSAAPNKSDRLTGTGVLNVLSGAAPSSLAVPEPSSPVLAAFAVVGLAARRRKSTLADAAHN